jgi:hypothetical protein
MHASLIALLDGGLRVGFASGRGKSLHEGLRKWVPEHHWADIELGLYNGAVQLTLANAIPEITTPSQLMQDVVARLQATPFTDMLELTPRSGQVGVQVQAGAFFRAGRLAELVTDVLARAPRLPVKAVASGHSVDVIADETSKVRVLERVASVAAGPVLAVGDQGDIGGNDFELLAATPWSISAARCSSDPSRCWCVDPIGRIGPAAVVPLLQAIDVSLGMASLDVRRIAKRRRHA